MDTKAAKRLLLALGLLATMAASADGGNSRSFDSYYHGENPGKGGYDLRKGTSGGGWDEHFYRRHVAGVPEPYEWLSLGVGLALFGVVAYRRRARFGK